MTYQVAFVRYTGRIRDWLSGILEWHRATDRYRPAALAEVTGGWRN